MIILTGQCMSNQHIYLQKGKIRFMKKEAKTLKEKRQQELKQQRIWNPLEYDLWIRIILYHWDRRVRDLDNYCKLIYDAMTEIVYKYDSQIEHMYISKKYDKHNPRVEIEIKQSLSFDI